LTTSEKHQKTTDGNSKTYRLKFVPEALEEWKALDGSVSATLKQLLKKRLAQPHVPGSALHANLNHCYKIKLRKQGIRLVYHVNDNELIVLVLAVDKREKMAAYRAALNRLIYVTSNNQ